MAAETVTRRWTIASWLVAHAADALDAVVATLGELEVDACALQSVRRSDAEQIADGLGFEMAWELSHHPVSRLVPGRGVGLAVLSPHPIEDSVSFVTNNHSSTWSRDRRIAHFAVVRRADQSAYTVGHSVASPDPQARGVPPAPLVWCRPPQVGVDVSRAVELPDGAELVADETRQPVEHAPQVVAVTFEMPWVTGGFAGP